MMRPEQMMKMDLIGPKEYTEHVIDLLYTMQVYHIVDHKKTETLDLGTPLEKSERLSEILVKVRALLSHLHIQQDKKFSGVKKRLTEKEYYALGKRSRKLYGEVTRALEKSKEIHEELQRRQEAARVLRILSALDVDADMLRASAHLTPLIGSITLPKNFRVLLQQSVPDFHLQQAAVEGKQYLALFVEKGQEEKARGLLNQHNFSELNRTLERATNLKQEQKRNDEVIRKLKDRKQQLKKKLAKIGEEQRAFLLLNEHLLSIEAKKAAAPLRFGSSKEAFFIQGWVPAKRMQEVTKALNQVTKNSIYIETSIPTREEEIPIKLRNPKPAEPFQFFLELFSLPKYNELDPTMLMAFTFPLFFGIMLGDVGYGIVTLGLWLLLKKKMPSAKGLLNIMIYASLVTILFGGIYGEYFGFEHVSQETGAAWCNVGFCLPEKTVELHGEMHTIHDFPRVLNRFHGEWELLGYSMPTVLIIGAIIGLLHLNLGLLLGFYNVYVAHGFADAVLEKASWIVLELGIVLLVLHFLGYPIPLYGGAGIFLIAVFMLYKGEGVQGLVEMPALLTNTLSYMRLGAVGLASVGLAMVVNEKFVLPYLERGGFFILMGVALMIAGHLVNIALGIIGPFLHSLRLHYVEFFTKFYKGGGMPYTPFGMREES